MFGRPRSTTVDHGRPWSIVGAYERPRSTPARNRPRSTTVDRGRPLCDFAMRPPVGATARRRYKKAKHIERPRAPNGDQCRHWRPLNAPARNRSRSSIAIANWRPRTPVFACRRKLAVARGRRWAPAVVSILRCRSTAGVHGRLIFICTTGARERPRTSNGAGARRRSRAT